MLVCDASQCKIAGDITVANAASFFTELTPHIVAKIPSLDFSNVGHVDSSALALILSCMREAQQQRYSLRFSGLPANVLTLAELYGITALLPA